MLYLKALAHPYHLLLYIHKVCPQSTKTHMNKAHVPLNIPLPCTLVQSPCMLTITHLHMNITMRTPNITISHALNTYSPWCIPLRYLSLITTRASNSISHALNTYSPWCIPLRYLSLITTRASNSTIYVHIAPIILGTPLSCTKYNHGTRSNSTIVHAHGIYYPWYTPFIHLITTRMHSLNSKILRSHSTYHLWYTPFVHLNAILACTPKTQSHMHLSPLVLPFRVPKY